MEEQQQRRAAIPLYARIGWVAAWVLMAVIVSMILHNCVNSVYYGSRTSGEAVRRYYDMGRRAGEAGKEDLPADPGLENPVLRKSFNKGYRDGLDAAAR